MRINRGRVLAAFVLVLVGLAGQPRPAAAQTPLPRVLYLSHAAGFAHEVRHHAGQVIASLGQSASAFTVTQTDDVGQLTAANLANYDAVVFFTSGELPIDDAQKAALLQFVSSGKGFVGVHSATDTFHTTWPEYRVMLGGRFQTHPWTQLATIRVEDTSHRATAHLGASFAISDEIYQFQDWARANVHVLLSLDTTSVPPLGTRPDNDYALAWTKPYGSGRVFYTALGHDTPVWDDVRFQQHVLQGIRWALGDADRDADNDGLLDSWELRFGLDRHSATGDQGPAGDPDGDGVTNAQEQAANTHPLGLHQRYLAEGATGTFFDSRIAIVNPHPQATAHVQLRFQREDGSLVATDLALAPRSRRTVFVDDVPEMGSASFSTLAESDQPVVVDRTMTWADGQAYGSHAESSVDGPSTHWYFAEGATHWRFDLFYLIQNPSTTETAQIAATFLRSVGGPIERTFAVAPNARMTIPVDAIPGLEEADVAAAFASTNDVPVIIERAMYLSRPEQTWAGGHASAGVTALASRWFLAEGATGSFFDTFILVGNPNPTPASIRVSYLPADGPVVVRTHTVDALSRLTLHLGSEAPQLAQTTASTIVEVTNDVPVVVERAMWWPGPTALTWYEGHSSVATTQTGVEWALADGEAGGARAARTYLLVATADGPPQDSVRLSVYVEGGETLERLYPNLLTPNRRFTFEIEEHFPEVAGRRFGVRVEALGSIVVGDVMTPSTPMPIVVERAMYHDVGGLLWAAGSNVVATRLR